MPDTRNSNGTQQAGLCELIETDLDTLDAGANAWPSKIIVPDIDSDSNGYRIVAPVRRRTIAD